MSTLLQTIQVLFTSLKAHFAGTCRLVYPLHEFFVPFRFWTPIVREEAHPLCRIKNSQTTVGVFSVLQPEPYCRFGYGA